MSVIIMINDLLRLNLLCWKMVEDHNYPNYLCFLNLTIVILGSPRRAVDTNQVSYLPKIILIDYNRRVDT